MKPIMIASASIIAAAAAVWIGSIYVPLPNRFAILWVAIAIDWMGYLGLIIILRTTPFFAPKLGKRLNDIFAYYPGVNIEHHVDRMNSFITLVFGHIILSVLYQSSASFGLNAYVLGAYVV